MGNRFLTACQGAHAGGPRAKPGPGSVVEAHSWQGQPVRISLAMTPVPFNSTAAFTFSASGGELK